MRYNPKLDTLRAFAALSVLSCHYTPWAGWGWAGVPLFFVLSGYLITCILLESKKNNGSLAGYIGDFFRRRALRLFPAYFLFLTILCLCQISMHQFSVVKDMQYLLTYTFNFRMLDHPGGGAWRGYYGQLWSLSVEWQFYLFWPFAVWLLNEKTLRRVLLGIVCLAPLLRWLSVRWLIHRGDYWIDACQITYLMTWTHLDALALGCLLAWSDWRAWFRSRRVQLAGVGGAVAAGVLVATLGFRSGYWTLSTAFESLGYQYGLIHFKEYVWGYSILAICFAIVIATCTDLSKGTNGIFRWEWLRYLGKVSYGFYIFHAVVIGAIVGVLKTAEAKDRALFSDGSIWTLGATAAGYALCVAVTFALAHVSFHYVERWFLRLEKRRILPVATT